MDKFILAKTDALLLIVDIQEKLASAMKKRSKIVANCQHLIEAARLLDIPILLTEQYPKGLGHTVPEIKEVLPSCDPVEKTTFDCCMDDHFMAKLSAEKRQTIILTGMEAHICVLQTCLTLIKQGYDVHVVRDGVCSRTKDNFLAGLEFMRDAGAVISCTETVLFQLLEKAGTEEFKTIAKRIK